MIDFNNLAAQVETVAEGIRMDLDDDAPRDHLATMTAVLYASERDHRRAVEMLGVALVLLAERRQDSNAGSQIPEGAKIVVTEELGVQRRRADGVSWTPTLDADDELHAQEMVDHAPEHWTGSRIVTRKVIRGETPWIPRRADVDAPPRTV